MGRKCAVDGCLSDSGRKEDTGVTFHKVPTNADVRPKWISLCRIPEDKKSMKVIYICSRHFLRIDFCNFKGKKYMLRQGVFPSVFPWDKSKLEAIKSTKTEPETEIKEEVEDENKRDIESGFSVKEEPLDIKAESLDAAVKDEPEEGKEKIKFNSNGPINFAINSRIEALDNNNTWYPARIVEEDYEENEVLIHFEISSNKHDEWICMDSPRLRPLQTEATTSQSAKKNQIVEQFLVGERCLASWSDARKFPATVTKVLGKDTYEVLFDDGFVKNLKAHRMCKSEGRPMQSSPLFDPIQSSKQERRDKKRKINIAELFGKRQRLDNSEERVEKLKAHTSTQQPPPPAVSTNEVFEPWVPQWDGGKPVGAEASIEAHDGPRKSIIVPDPRIPEGWTKHLTQRIHGASAGKWDTIIVSPDNRRFRSRSEVKTYLEETKLMKYNWSMFDFSLHRHRNRKRDLEESPRLVQETPPETFEKEDTPELKEEEEGENKTYLKIPIVDDAYQCPIEGCGKTYRKENLAQMHVKHYHPEYTKFLDSTPNVADLAYARTVGESLDKSPTSSKTPTAKPIQKSATSLRSATKSCQSPQLELNTESSKPQSPLPLKNKDSEIIKLLNTKPSDNNKKEDPIKPLPAGLPSSMYPDIKLKDLLIKSEGIPNRDDLNLRALSSTRPPTGIKTLLPVVRPERREEVDGNRVRVKRKRGLIDPVDSPKGNELNTYIPQQETPPLDEPNTVIVEGGKLIKIVRMKQEEIINCTCGYTEEDGLMIQCDLCLCWQHAFCNSIYSENEVPDKYVCYICQNPTRQRLSRKYYHDQDWLKQGFLPATNFHTRDEEMLSKRFEKLKKSHDISGGLLEVTEFVNSLKVKLKIAEAKNHPKLYLWSKPWEKLPLPEKMAGLKTEEAKDGLKDNPIKSESTDSMLMMILKGTKEEVDDNLNSLPIVPQPEAPIDSADCRLNLLEHIAHSQSLVEERLDDFEKQIEDLEDSSFYEDDQDYPKTRQTLSMLLRDLSTLQELSQLTTL